MTMTRTDSSPGAFNRREFIHGALAGAVVAALPISAFSADHPRPPIGAESNTEDA